MIYNPIYVVTPRVLKSISAIENAKAVIETSPLLPLYERQFKKDAFVRMAHFGTAVEGNKLDMGNVLKIIDGKGEEVVGRERDIQEVLNYRKVVYYIDNFKEKSISSEVIKEINTIVTDKLVDDTYRGKYRHNQNYFVNLVTKERIFTPPPADQVVELMESFVDFLETEKGKATHPAIKAGIVHDRIVSIHPFADGNGRTARACATLSLYLDNYDIKKFFSLEEYYDQDILAYYKAISEGHQDLTAWVEYFCEGLAIEFAQIKERVLKMSRDVKIKEKVGQVFLSERQEKVIDWLNNYSRLKNSDFKKIFPDISEDTVLRDLKELQKNKIIAKHGSTKNSFYSLK
jgi:Fic family protein